jgi:prophage regulatory protein
MRKLIRFEGLKERGIPFSRVHIARLMKEGRFPRKIMIGANTVSWDEAEVDQYISDRVAERDTGKTA